MDNIINITESTVLINRKYYEEHCKKFRKLMKNNKKRVNKIKNLKRTIHDSQVANQKYKNRISNLEKELHTLKFERDCWKDKCLDKITDNQILHNELAICIGEGYEVSSSYKKYIESCWDNDNDEGGFLYD